MLKCDETGEPCESVNFRAERCDCDSCVEYLTNWIMGQKWYLLGLPWTRSEHADMAILAGHEDPHVAVYVADLQDFSGDNFTDETAQAIARHIVDVHNRSLDSQG